MFLKLGTDPSGSTVKRGSQGFAECACVLLSHGDYVQISYGTPCGKCRKGTRACRDIMDPLGSTRIW